MQTTPSSLQSQVLIMQYGRIVGFTADPHTLVPPYRYIVLSQAFRPYLAPLRGKAGERDLNQSTSQPAHHSQRVADMLEK